MTTMAHVKSSTSRSANWSKEEVVVLVEGVSSTDVLTRKFSPSFHRSDRDEFWRNLTERVNSVGGMKRSKDQVYKKWQDIKRETKKKETLRRQSIHVTGGGPPPQPLSDLQEKIVSTIPVCCMEGINGGSDTSLQGQVFDIDDSISSMPVASGSEIYDCQETENTVENTRKTDKDKTLKRKRSQREDTHDVIISLENEKLEEMKKMRVVLESINATLTKMLDMYSYHLFDGLHLSQ